MSIRKTATVAALTATGTNDAIGSISLGAPYARVLGFRVANWASSAKAAEGTSTTQKLKLTDADGLVLFLDAAARDYGATSGAPSGYGFTVFFQMDETALTGGALAADHTGAALSSQGGPAGVIAKSPVAVVIDAGETATDYVEVSLFVEV